MEEKMFELMEKIYVKVTNLEGDVKDIKSNIVQVNERLDKVDNRLVKVEQNQVKLEQEITRKTELLLDGYNSNFELINKVDTKVDYLVERTTKNELELKAFVKSKIHQG